MMAIHNPNTGMVPFKDIVQARQLIEPHIIRTPMVHSSTLSEITQSEIHIKLEHRQETGSFKLRGATNAVLQLKKDEKRRGIVAVSTGNHGRALACAARRSGVRCVIVMSVLVPQNKVEGIRKQGAEIIIHGRSQDEAQSEVERLINEDGMVTLPPFDHPHIIAGQGTLGLEILEDLAKIDTILVQVSGGGLISGIAQVFKTASPSTRVVGISMERGAAMHASVAAARPVQVEELPTLADSLGGGIGPINTYTFGMTRALVDEIVLLSEEEIAVGIRHAYWQEEEIVEGSGAVGLAALIAGKIENPGNCVVITTGRNIDLKQHHRLISGEMIHL